MIHPAIAFVARTFARAFKHNASKYPSLANVLFHFTGSSSWMTEEYQHITECMLGVEVFDPLYKSYQKRLKVIETLLNLSDKDVRGFSSKILNKEQQKHFIINVQDVLSKIDGVKIVHLQYPQNEGDEGFINFTFTMTTKDNVTIELDFSLSSLHTQAQYLPLSNFHYEHNIHEGKQIHILTTPTARNRFTLDGVIESVNIFTLENSKLFYLLKSYIKPLLAAKKLSLITAQQLYLLLTSPANTDLKNTVWNEFNNKVEKKLQNIKTHFPACPTNAAEIEAFLLDHVLETLLQNEISLTSHLESQLQFLDLHQQQLEKALRQTEQKIKEIKAKSPAAIAPETLENLRAKNQSSQLQIEQDLETHHRLIGNVLSLSLQHKQNADEITELKKQQTTNAAEITRLNQEKLQTMRSELNVAPTVKHEEIKKLKGLNITNEARAKDRTRILDNLRLEANNLNAQYEQNVTSIATMKQQQTEDALIIEQLQTELKALDVKVESKVEAGESSIAAEKKKRVRSRRIKTTPTNVIVAPCPRKQQLFTFIENLKSKSPAIYELISVNKNKMSDRCRVQMALVANSLSADFNAVFTGLTGEAIPQFINNAAANFKPANPVLFVNLLELAQANDLQSLQFQIIPGSLAGMFLYNNNNNNNNNNSTTNTITNPPATTSSNRRNRNGNNQGTKK